MGEIPRPGRAPAPTLFSQLHSTDGSTHFPPNAESSTIPQSPLTLLTEPQPFSPLQVIRTGEGEKGGGLTPLRTVGWCGGWMGGQSGMTMLEGMRLLCAGPGHHIK